jgi:hypothetical protein
MRVRNFLIGISLVVFMGCSTTTTVLRDGKPVYTIKSQSDALVTYKHSDEEVTGQQGQAGLPRASVWNSSVWIWTEDS